MAAQSVKEMSLDDARRLVAGGKLIRTNTYVVPSKNITVTLREKTKPGFVKVIVMAGCVC